VGVGTPSPSQKLSVEGTSFVGASFNGIGIGDSTERLRVGYKDGTPDTGLVPSQIIASTSTLQFASRDNSLGTITFATGTGIPERMRITSAGGVSFGSSGTAYGTSGQVLQSNGNAAPTWVTNISGNAANVTGTVAVANGGTGLTTTPANGALDIGNGTGFTRTTLTAGSNITITNASGSITIASSGATPGPAFSAYSNTNQTVSNTTGVVIAANTEEYDTGGCYNNTGSTVTLNGLSVPAYSFCPNVAGYYQISGGIQYGYSTCNRALIQLVKNGAGYKRLTDLNTNPNSLTGSSTVYLNGTGDYINIQGYMSATGTLTFNGGSGDTTLTWINGSMVRSA
jgi:hypothetical protein